MLSPARILVVDDNRSNRFVFEQGLGSQGYVVVEAVDGPEALRLLEATLAQAPNEPVSRDVFDLVVLDIMMPEMDGTEVLREIRKRKSRSELPVIMATAKDTTEDIVEALAAGACDFVVKPVNLAVLYARVETQLALGRTHRALLEAHHALVRGAKMETAGYLAAGVAHEIRNPLARIAMSVDTLRRDEYVATKRGKVLDMINSSLAKADEIVRNLMKLAREKRLDLQAEDANALLTESLSMMEAEATWDSVRVETDLAPDLPPALVARSEFIQTILGLLENALQAMDGTEGTLTIRTSMHTAESIPESEGMRTGNRIRRGDDVVRIEILDSGPGLTGELGDRLFDPFYTTRPTGSGVGLGLSVARSIVTLHGGLLTLRNRDSPPGACACILLRKADSMLTGA